MAFASRMLSDVLDTSNAAATAQREALRRLGTSGRLEIGIRFSEEVRAVAIEATLRRHPEWTHEEAKRAVFRAIYGDELADRVYASR